jgi:hypothetical protein
VNDPIGSRAALLMWFGLAAIGLGLSVLLVYAWVEVLNNPGLTLVDGYWIGRVPWTPAGVWLVLVGSVVSAIGGAMAILVSGDWLRRILAVGVVLLPTFWWATALGFVPFPRYEAPDPVTLAYSVPETAVLFLILPALALLALWLTPIRPGPVRLRPIRRP